MKEFLVDPLNPDREIMKQAAQAVREGKIIAFPTDTVYGLGASIFNDLAMEKTYNIKGRLRSKTLIAFIDDPKMLDEVVSRYSKRAKKLTKKFWPGALTIIFPARAGLPAAIVKNGTIGVRMPNSKISLELVRLLGHPLATTSANRSGFRSSVNAGQVRKTLEGIDVLLDGGPVETGIESTIVDDTVEPPVILRSGAIADEEIRRELRVER